MKFNILYVDPPWAYKVYSKKGQGRSAENHYRTMNIEDIYGLDIQSIAADDCILFLWVTFPCLEQGLETIRRWGFTYKTLGFCWVKRCRKQQEKWFWGLGFWTRANPELCLIATKGQPKRVSKAVHCIVDTPVEEHSKKPILSGRRLWSWRAICHGQSCLQGTNIPAGCAWERRLTEWISETACRC